MDRIAFPTLLGVIATLAIALAAGLHDVRAADAAHEAARRDFKRDLAAAKICQHQAFAWEGNTLTCFKEATR